MPDSPPPDVEKRLRASIEKEESGSAARGALEWLVNDDWKVAFSGDYTQDDAQPKGYQRLRANNLCPLFGITCAPNESRWDTQSDLAPLNGTDSMGASLVVSCTVAPSPSVMTTST